MIIISFLIYFLPTQMFRTSLQSPISIEGESDSAFLECNNLHRSQGERRHPHLTCPSLWIPQVIVLKRNGGGKELGQQLTDLGSV